MPGAIPLLESLRTAGFRLAVGSSAPPENVDLVLDWRNLRDLFDAVVTGADVARGKPDPQVFQLAAQRLGAPPQRCVVIEDARRDLPRPRRRAWPASAWSVPAAPAPRWPMPTCWLIRLANFPPRCCGG